MIKQGKEAGLFPDIIRMRSDPLKFLAIKNVGKSFHQRQNKKREEVSHPFHSLELRSYMSERVGISGIMVISAEDHAEFLHDFE